MEFIEISLLPESVKKAKKAQMLSVYAVMVGIVVLGAFVGIIWNQNQRISKINKKIKKIDAESASLRDKIDEVKRFRNIEDVYKKKKARIEKLLEAQSVWTELMDQLAEKLPPDIWLIGIEQKKIKEEGIEISLLGNSPTKVMIADFMKKMEESDKFMNITAAEMREQGNDGRIVVNFLITCIYRTGIKKVKK